VAVNFGGQPAVLELGRDNGWTPLGGGPPVGASVEMAPWSSVWLDGAGVSAR